MGKKIFICLCLVLFTVVSAGAGEKDKKKKEKAADADAKELAGMSIVGNDEAPKSLYIVPWKSSEIGVETSLDSMLNEGDMPVDRVVFKRQLDFYNVSKAQ